MPALMRHHVRIRLFASFTLAALFHATVAFAAQAPFTVDPYIQDIGPASVTVKWEGPAGEASVEYGTSVALGRSVAADVSGQPATARITGLLAGTGYYYRVVAGGSASAVSTFRTLPEAGAFTFAVYGDTRTNPSSSAKVEGLILKHAPAFVLHTGDVVEDGTQRGAWTSEFFRPAGPLISQIAIFAAAGNHDRESAYFYDYLGAPSRSPWYSFDCANAHFTMLDSEVDLSVGSPQYQWLIGDLSGAAAQWKFVAFHRPLYSSGFHGSSVGLRGVLQPVFEQYGVDVAFSGHDHDYERTFPICSSADSQHVVTYVVAGGGGAPAHGVGHSAFTARSRNGLSFATVTVDGDSLDLAGYAGTDVRFDGLRIVKSPAGYANDYLDSSGTLRQIAVKASINRVLKKKTFRAAGRDTTRRLKYAFAAPAWGDLEIDLHWTSGASLGSVSPSDAHLAVKAGTRTTASFTWFEKAGDAACPSLTVSGRTADGEFSMEKYPILVRP